MNETKYPIKNDGKRRNCVVGSCSQYCSWSGCPMRPRPLPCPHTTAEMKEDEGKEGGVIACLYMRSMGRCHTHLLASRHNLHMSLGTFICCDGCQQRDVWRQPPLPVTLNFHRSPTVSKHVRRGVRGEIRKGKPYSHPVSTCLSSSMMNKSH